MSPLAAWVLALMTALSHVDPGQRGFAATADAIAAEAEASPLPGAGPARTAALLVAVAWFESGFVADAEGDCAGVDPGQRRDWARCPDGHPARSLCLLQVGASNLRSLGVTREAIVGDVRECVRAGLRLMRASWQACRGRPLRERLVNYAAGGGGCAGSDDAARKSRHRVDLAARLLADHPAP